MASPKSRVATLILRDEHVYVFSCMRVERVGVTTRRLERSGALAQLDAAGLGKWTRLALEQSLAWVASEVFERELDDGVDPLAAGLGLKERDVSRALATAGRISIADWPDSETYVVDRWVRAGKAGRASALPCDRPAVRKDGGDASLGAAVLLDLQDSRDANLARSG
jgi:hypothetical protein